MVVAAGVLANDANPDGRPLSAVLAGGPAVGALDLRPDGSFTYVPDNGFAGRDVFTTAPATGRPRPVRRR